MTTLEILFEVRSRGVRLETNGERLRVDAPVGALTPELKAALAANKPEILRHLVSSVETRLEAAGFRIGIDRATGSALLVFSQSDAEAVKDVATVYRADEVTLTPEQRQELENDLNYYERLMTKKTQEKRGTF